MIVSTSSTMTRPILFDTCVFIHYFKSKPAAQVWVSNVINLKIPGCITLLNDYELFIGARDNTEKKRYRSVLAFFKRADLHTVIARRAAELAAPFWKVRDKSISAPDFLMAATAEYYHYDILTHNVKHFNRIPLVGVNVISYTA